MCKTALPVSDHGCGEVEDTSRYTASVHEVTGQNEERYCQQGLAVDTVEHLLKGKRNQVEAASDRKEED